MIGAAGVANRQRGHAEIVEGLHPLREKRCDGFVALQIDAANFSRAVVHVVIRVELRLLGQHFNFLRGGRVRFPIREMLLHISARTEQALLFAGPQADAHGTAQPNAGGFENTHGFQHYTGACTVIRGAGPRVPGIKVRANHHDFVGFGFVGARNFTDDVEGIQVVFVKLVLNVRLQRNGNFLFQHTREPPIIFAGDGHARGSGRILGVASAAS